MRRMITDKQQAFVKSVGQAVQPIALYPLYIDAKTTDIDWSKVEASVENKNIDLENHVISENTLFYFYFPELLAQYGIGDGGTPGYVTLSANDNIDIPQNVTNFEELKAWMCTEEFIDDFTFSPEESIMSNENISYYQDEVELDIYNGLLRCSVSFVTEDEADTPVIEATDPQYNGIEVKNIQTSTIQAPDGVLTLKGLGDRPYIEIVNDKVYFNQISIYAGSIKVTVTNSNNSFEAYIPTQYITSRSDFLQPTGGIGIMLYGNNTLSTQIKTAINTAKPTKLRFKPSRIGQVPNVYGITNTKIIIDKNIYIWDNNDGSYVLQGTFQSLSTSSIQIVLIEPSMPIKLYHN